LGDAEKLEQAKERLGKLAAELAPQLFRVLPN